MSAWPPRPPRLSRWLLRRLAPASLREEIVADADQAFRRDAERLGRSAARRRYRRELRLLGPLALRRACGRASSIPPAFPAHGVDVSSLLHDARFALRILRRRPLTSVAVIFTLGLAIGSATATFSVVDAVVLRPLPIPDPSRAVALLHVNLQEERSWSALGALDVTDLRERSDALTAVAGQRTIGVTYTDGPEPQRLLAVEHTRDLDRVLGLTPEIGRLFGDPDFEWGAPPVVLLDHSFWQNQLGADPTVIGRSLTLDGIAHEIVGVLADRDLAYPSPEASLWLPLRIQPGGWQDQRGPSWLSAVARVRPDLDLGAAQAEVDGVMADLERAFPDTNSGKRVRLQPLREQLVGDIAGELLLLFGAVGAVLLIACANVASLLLARSAARATEFAVRASLGAGARRIARQVLIESLALASCGGLLGLGVAGLLRDGLLALSPTSLPRAAEIAIDPVVLVFALAITLAVALLIGLLPARKATGASPAAWLSGGRGVPGASRAPLLRRGLVIVETALSVGLLAAALLLTRSYLSLAAVDPGFEPAGVLSARVVLPEGDYADEGGRRAFLRELVDGAGALPGVRAAGAVNHLPFAAGVWGTSFRVAGRPEPEPGTAPQATLRQVSPDFFRVLGIPVLAGRVFSVADDAGAERVAVVSERVARQVWPSESPLGANIVWEDATWRVIGVVGDVRRGDLATPPPPALYVPIAQSPPSSVYVVLAAEGDPGALAGPLRGLLRRLDPRMPLLSLATMRERLDEAVAPQRFRAALPSSLGLIALVLAVVGTYSVMAGSVASRSREIGVRMALGAQPAAVLRQVLVSASALTGAGAAIGLLGATLLGRTIDSYLYGVTPADPVSLLLVAGGIGGLGLIAAYGPARRAARIDPVAALRRE